MGRFRTNDVERQASRWMQRQRAREESRRERSEALQYEFELKRARKAYSALVNERDYNPFDLRHKHDPNHCSKAQCYGIAEALGSGPDDVRRFYERWAEQNPE